MADVRVTVDESSGPAALSLTAFRDQLANRIEDATSLLTRLMHLSGSRPELGSFVDANRATYAYKYIQQQEVDRARRLLDALWAAHKATGDIIANYGATEDHNQKLMDELADSLASIDDALRGAGLTPASGTLQRGQL